MKNISAKAHKYAILYKMLKNYGEGIDLPTEEAAYNHHTNIAKHYHIH